MESALSPVMINIYMEYIKELAKDILPLKLIMLLRHIDDTFILWKMCKYSAQSCEFNITFHTSSQGKKKQKSN